MKTIIIENPVVFSGNIIANEQVHNLRRLKEQTQALFPNNQEVMENLLKEFDIDIVNNEPRARKLVGCVGIENESNSFILKMDEWTLVKELVITINKRIPIIDFLSKHFDWSFEKSDFLIEAARAADS